MMKGNAGRKTVGNEFFGKIAKQGIFNIIILVAANLLGFLTAVLKTKAFSPGDIGIFTLVGNIASLLSLVTLLGLPSLYIKYIPYLYQNRADMDNRKRMGVIITYSILFNIFLTVVALGIFIAFRDVIVERFFRSGVPGDMLVMTGLLMFVTNLMTITSTLLRACYRSSTSNFYSNVFLRVLILAVILVAIQFRITIFQFIYLYIAIHLVTGFILVLQIRSLKAFQLTLSVDKVYESDEFKGMIRYTFVMFLSGAAASLIYKMDTLMLGYYKDTYSTGIYSIALAIGNLLGAVMGGVSMIANPVIAALLNEDNLADLRRMYLLTTRWSIVLSVPVFLVMVFYARNILNVLGSEYSKGFMVLIIIAIGQLLNTVTGVCGGIIALSRHYRLDLYTQIILLLTNLILNSLLIPIYGMEGAAIATAVSIGFNNLIKLRFVHRIYGLLPYNWKSLYMVVVSVGMGWMVYSFSTTYGILHGWQIVLLTVVLYMLYFALMAVFLEKEEKEMVGHALQKLLKRG